MYNKEEIVDALNELIYAAVLHGADSGGSYNMNGVNLKRNIDLMLRVLNLDGDYVSVIADVNGDNKNFIIPTNTLSTNK